MPEDLAANAAPTELAPTADLLVPTADELAVLDPMERA
jgi:hypothetical protein